MGPTKISDVEKAQQDIVMQLKDLESKGKALISRGGDGDAFV
jgi:flagellar motor switch protein FliG